MGKMGCGLAIAIIAAFGISEAYAEDGAAPITKIEARRLPPNVVKRHVLDQLFDILVLEPYPKIAERPKHELTDLSFWTRAHGAYVSGLCEADQLTVTFDPVGLEPKGADTPVKVSGISARGYYRFLTLPVGVSGAEMSLADRKALDRRCAGLDPDQINFFQAENDDDARDGALVLQAVLRQAATGSISTVHGCAPEDTAKACAAFVAGASLDKLKSIEWCNIPNDPVAGRCTDIWAGDVSLVVHYDGFGDKIQINRVDVGELVTIGDYRED